MKTRNDLINTLETFAWAHRIVDFSVSNSENYGRRSMIYVPVSMHRRAELEAWLLERGFKVNQNYFPGAGVIEVQVKYFKRSRLQEMDILISSVDFIKL
jgi:3'-phosphoadenosine 5'-phosphosulfate sulfotransferase (PAPS reductase)/FAD synthetase